MDREAWQATRYSPCGRKELDTTEHTRKGGKKEQMELADLNIPKLHIIILKSGFPTQGLKKKKIKKKPSKEKRYKALPGPNLPSVSQDLADM